MQFYNKEDTPQLTAVEMRTWLKVNVEFNIKVIKDSLTETSELEEIEEINKEITLNFKLLDLLHNENNDLEYILDFIIENEDLSQFEFEVGDNIV